MPGAQPLDTLAGGYTLHPGRSPAIAGHRPVLAPGRLAALLQGRARGDLAAAIAGLFTLCAHAHRRVGAAALAAAAGEPAPTEDAATLRLETARDHLRTLALDWPARAGEVPDPSWLRGCPVSLAGGAPADAAGTLQRLAPWLERELLGQPAAAWLARAREPEGLADWCARRADWQPGRCLMGWRPVAGALMPQPRSLDVLDGDAAPQVAELARALAADPGFAQRPHWRGAPCENGPWERLRHRRDGGAWLASAWTRMAARWIELVELAAAAPGTAALLHEGALRLGPGEAIAWCEMARGLLFHWVRLDAAGTVADYRVLAPTEWNFHPEGSLARALQELAPTDTAGAGALAAAYDPCVACAVVAAA